MGTVRAENGDSIRGAVITATNPNNYPPQITTTTDDKGRWALLGLTLGQWQFSIEAPGFVTQTASVAIRTQMGAPIVARLPRDPGPIPDALDRNILQQITDAHGLRDRGQLDQAIAAYREIRNRNRKLTSIHFALADAYRRKAQLERSPDARRAALQQAMASYDELLTSDATNARARAELEATRTLASTESPR